MLAGWTLESSMIEIVTSITVPRIDFGIKTWTSYKDHYAASNSLWSQSRFCIGALYVQVDLEIWEIIIHNLLSQLYTLTRILEIPEL